MYGHARGSLVSFADTVQIAEVQAGMETLSVHIESHRDDVQIARALPVAEQRAFDTISSSQQSKFGCGGSGSTVVVGVKTDQRLVSLLQVPAKPFDLVGMHVWREQFDGRREVQDDGIFFGRFPCFHDRFANLERVVHLGIGKTFGRVLQPHLGTVQFREQVANELYAVHRDLLDLFLRHTEGYSPLERRGGIVYVYDGLFRPFQALESASNKMFASLGEHLKGNAFGHTVLVDELARKVEFSLCGRWETDLDFLEADFCQQIEKFQLLFHSHGRSTLHQMGTRSITLPGH